MTLRGMTWDHARAYRPLEAFSATESGTDVQWSRQSLADFEAYPLADLARDYDLLIMDHPGLGAARRADALLPVDAVADSAELAAWQALSVGSTWRSYAAAGHQWAVPIDAAAQVSVLRPELDAPAPTDWSGVLELAAEVGTVLCLGGPHAFLGLLGMCASASTADATGDPDQVDQLLDPVTAGSAIDVLRAVWAHSDREASLGDPIAVHDAMAVRPELQYCPLAYGYAAYARPSAPGCSALRWADAPGLGSARPGTVLGGTGLALSVLSGADPAELHAFVSGFLAADVQGSLVPEAGGQPASVLAWDSPAVDAAWGGYYSSTRRSLDAAHVRPRLPGWIGLQDRASTLVRSAVFGDEPAAEVIGRINDAFRRLAADRAGASA